MLDTRKKHLNPPSNDYFNEPTTVYNRIYACIYLKLLWLSVFTSPSHYHDIEWFKNRAKYHNNLGHYNIT